MDELEAESRGTEIQAAILHILDGRRHRIMLSEGTLDLEEPPIEKYVKRYVNRCRKDMRMRPGTFHEDSPFAEELRKYFHKETTLPEFSAAVSAPLIRYFETEEARSFEALFADYRTDDVPYLAVVLLEEIDTMTPVTEADPSGIRNTIHFGDTALPAFSKPVTSLAVVNMINEEIQFVDDTKWKDGISVIREILLEAEAGISRKEVVESVKTIAVELAEEFDENPTVMLSKVKNYISETVKEGMPLKTEVLAEKMFDEQPEMSEAFRKKAEEKTLPVEVELPKAALSPSLKKQRIKTDTGIEITVPAEYFQNKEFIEFRNHPDGMITIEIKQIGAITNKI